MDVQLELEMEQSQRRHEEQETARQAKREALMERIAAKQAEREKRHQKVDALKVGTRVTWEQSSFDLSASLRK